MAVGDEGELFEEKEYRVVVHRLPKKKKRNTAWFTVCQKKEKKEYRVVVHRLPKKRKKGIPRGGSPTAERYSGRYPYILIPYPLEIIENCRRPRTISVNI